MNVFLVIFSFNKSQPDNFIAALNNQL